MDILLFSIGFLLMLAGIAGSLLPVLPGPPLSWLGLLLLYLTRAVPNDWLLLGLTFFIALAVVVLDYVVPALGARRWGGSKAGMMGATLGLLLAVVLPVFGVFGIVVWPFLGALTGELLNNTPTQRAVKAAWGSVVGFLAGTFLKLVLAIGYLGIFLWKTWAFKNALFGL